MRCKYTFHSSEEGEEKWESWREEFLKPHFGWRAIFTKVSSSKLVAFYVPLFFIIVWIIIFLSALLK